MLPANPVTGMVFIKGWRPVVLPVIGMNMMVRMAPIVKDVIRQTGGAIDIK